MHPVPARAGDAETVPASDTTVIDAIPRRRRHTHEVTDPPQSPRPPSKRRGQAMTLEAAAPFRFDQIESGVRIVVSNALPVSAGRQFEQWLTAAVHDLRPTLKPFVPLIVAMMGGEGSDLASAAGVAAIVVWCRRKQWYSGNHPAGHGRDAGTRGRPCLCDPDRQAAGCSSGNNDAAGRRRPRCPA